MADDKVATPAAATAEPAPKLMLHSQFLQDMSFENPQGAKSLSKGELKPAVQVNLNVDSRKLGETLYEVALKITANATLDNEPCFVSEVDYRGVFSLTGVDPGLVPQILLIEGPRTLFPFARRIVADTVRDGGFPPLMLEPVDFVALYRNHAQKRAAEAPKTA
jgi:preprotein translocase subunit SecB